jgi:hypothetical protein
MKYIVILLLFLVIGCEVPQVRSDIKQSIMLESLRTIYMKERIEDDPNVPEYVKAWAANQESWNLWLDRVVNHSNEFFK